MKIITPIILLMGPSGAGKTTLANLASDEHNYLHIDFDLWGGDTEEIKPFKEAWRTFKDDHTISDLKTLVEEKVSAENKTGAILSFPSDDMVVDSRLIELAVKAGIYPVYLYAPAEKCLETFIAREKINGRGLPAEHWQKCNAFIYETDYLTQSHQPYILSAYTPEPESERKTQTALLSELVNRIENMYGKN
jgi:cytidylate kinase